MIYVYLSLFIISLLGLAYTLYSLEINRKLNIKKRQIAIRPNRNKFYIIFCINVLLVFTFGGLFVFKLFYRPKVPVIPVEEITGEGKSVNKVTSFTTLSNDIMMADFEGGKTDNESYYYCYENKLYRYDKKTKEIIDIKLKTSNFLLVRNNIVLIYEENNDNVVTTHIDLYDKKELKLQKEIIIDGALKKYFDISGLFVGYSANVIVESFDVNNIDKLGYVVATYTYEVQDEEEVVKKEVSDKIYISGTLMPQYHSYDRVLIHLQYSATTDTIKVKSLCLTDYYLSDVDGYIYLLCNSYRKDHFENESLILKYNPIDMTISDYHTYNNLFYSSPIVYREGITTYLSFIMYDIDYPSYYNVLIDNTLAVIDSKNAFIDNKDHVIGSKEKNALVFDNKVMLFDNILFYDNNVLLNYEIKQSDKQIIINEYNLVSLNINKYILTTEADFSKAKIIDIKKIEDNYLVIYEIDGKQGYQLFKEYEEQDDEATEEKNDTKINESIIELGYFSDDIFFIVNKELLVVKANDEEVEILSIEKLIKESQESGE